MKLISACLLGVPCRYDGCARPCARFTAEAAAGELLTVCPEVLGGLPTPRIPCEIVGGDGEDVLDGRARVMNREGRDMTEAFVRGARAAAALCERYGVTEAVLKANSPSCGCGRIYDGTFTGTLGPGSGVTCAALRRAGIRVRTEEEESEGE